MKREGKSVKIKVKNGTTAVIQKVLRAKKEHKDKE